MGKNTRYINGYERDCPANGIMRHKGEQVNSLPVVGSRIIVEQYKIKAKNAVWPARNEEGYVAHESYVDLYKRPRVYIVESYTKGIEEPFNAANSVVLKTQLRNGQWLKQTIKTMDIASGYLRLTKAPDEQKVVQNE